MTEEEFRKQYEVHFEALIDTNLESRALNYRKSYDLQQQHLLTHLIKKRVLITESDANFVIIYSNNRLVQIPITTWREGEQFMLCTVCKERLNSVNYNHIWRTLNTVKSGKSIQWARLPIHDSDECRELGAMEVAKARIGIAAGLNCYNFSFTDPKNIDERPIDPLTKERRNRL